MSRLIPIYKNNWLSLWIICAILALIGCTTTNPLETALGSLVWPILFTLLWRSGEPQIFLFAVSMQMLQVFAPVLSANLKNQTLQEVWKGSELSLAYYLSLFSILVLAYGMKLGLGKRNHLNFAALASSSHRLQIKPLVIAYIVTLAIATTGQALVFIIPGSAQFFLPILSFRWLVVFLIFHASFRKSSLRWLGICVTLLEIAIGFTGFFSEYKTVLFLFLIVYGGSQYRVSLLIRPRIILLVSVILMLSIYWQSIKGDYRQYVSKGTATQTVQVSVSDRLFFHSRAVEKLDGKAVAAGFESGLERLGYLEYFARSIRTVPAVVPHQNGKLWGEVIPHVTMPRFLFPNKPVLDDSARTNQFVGIKVAGAEAGTSISIGYVGESYIDFGVPGMFLPILALGWFWGWIYRWLSSQGSQPLLGLAAATTVIFNVAIFFESSNLKIVGGATSSMLVYWLFLRYGSNLVWNWLTNFSIQKARVM